ncbi:MAG: glutamyl-tRNA reductase, partial [Candidatus Krumholzibacteriota bacterium]|nr:glutamyl-tRNA reductase [Candidatus Krumholzibacteriota bacterium]
CTGSPGYVLQADLIGDAMAARPDRPLFLIDIAVPRDIDPAVRSMDNVFRYDIDDLSAIAEENRSRRTTEVVKAGEIIRNEVIAFLSWYRSLDAKPTVVSLRRRFEAVGEDEVKRIRRRFPSEMQDDLDSLSRSIINKLLHHPTIEIKNAASRGDDAYLVHALRQLFHLESPDDDE